MKKIYISRGCIVKSWCCTSFPFVFSSVAGYMSAYYFLISFQTVASFHWAVDWPSTRPDLSAPFRATYDANITTGVELHPGSFLLCFRVILATPCYRAKYLLQITRSGYQFLLPRGHAFQPLPIRGGGCDICGNLPLLSLARFLFRCSFLLALSHSFRGPHAQDARKEDHARS